MRRWWREKDFSDTLHEIPITCEKDIKSIVKDICNDVLNGQVTIKGEIEL